MRVRLALWAVLTPWLWLGCAPRTLAVPFAVRDEGRVEMGNATLRVVFQRAAEGVFQVEVQALHGAAWRPVFDGHRPLVQGASFDLLPAEVLEVTANSVRARARLGGHHADPEFAWDLVAECAGDSQPLQFRVTLHLPRQVTLSGLEPQAAFWMAGVAPDPVRVDQGPGNIYHGTASAQWGNSFPAAYLWTEGTEVAVLFDPEPMDWMGPRSLFRFHDCRVQSWDEDGRTAMGLRVVKRNFHELGPGEVVFDWWLQVNAGVARPRNRTEALDRLVRLLEPLHPSTATPLIDRATGRPATWTDLAAGVEGDLMRRGVVWEDLELPVGAPWRDLPAFPEHSVTRLRISTDYAVGSPAEPAQRRPNVLAGWDFSTCNNYLSAFLAAERASPNAERRAFLAQKTRTLPLFFDTQAGMLRHGTRYPLHVGDREMTWQNLMFAVEAVRVHRLMPAEDFEPAVGGRLLMSIPRLMELVRRSGDVPAQWFDPYALSPMVQGDVPELGVVYEPWQLGTYAWLMTEAFAMTGDAVQRDEAKRVLERLLDGSLRVSVANARYSVTYDDPADFPITEIFGNAWGMAAAARLAAAAAPGEAERWRSAADAFLNSLARLTYWYESATAGDARDQAVRQAGLFRNHGGAMTGSPWENAEASLALVARLGVDAEPRPLVLKLLNLQRLNAMSFFPRCLPGAAQPGPPVTGHVADSLPIEDAYTLEHGGRHGAGGLAAYMSGMAMWYALLFERWGRADDLEVMLVSLDVPLGFETAVDCEERRFLAYNPTPQAQPTTVRLLDLLPGTYRLILRQSDGQTAERRVVRAELEPGFPLALPAGGWVRIELSRQGDGSSASATLRQQSRDRLAAAYCAIQAAATREPGAAQTAAKGDYARSLAALRQGRWAESLAASQRALDAAR